MTTETQHRLSDLDATEDIAAAAFESVNTNHPHFIAAWVTARFGFILVRAIRQATYAIVAAIEAAK
jgi:hypothetical protein